MSGLPAEPDRTAGSTDLLPPAGWEETRARLVAFARKRLDDPDEVEDLVHGVLLRALARADDLRESGRLDAWLYQITRNALIDHGRRHHRRADALDGRVDDAIDRTVGEASRSGGAESGDARTELAGCLAPLVAGLPESYRLPLSLADFKGLSQKEVAERLGLSVSGAKSRVQRGRRLLRDRLLACCAVERDGGGTVVDYDRRRGGSCRSPENAAPCDTC